MEEDVCTCAHIGGETVLSTCLSVKVSTGLQIQHQEKDDIKESLDSQ